MRNSDVKLKKDENSLTDESSNMIETERKVIMKLELRKSR
jgi:hypothetical protein